MYNYNELSEDQATTIACYNWGGNDAHYIKLDPLSTLPLDFTVVDPELQHTKEKQKYRIRADMIFQMIKNKVPEKYFEL